ncbi:MAG: 50S ribosomal protein L10 [Anaerolineae bacterium]|nr:50S ribosomal protein L10 [Anaerolineae bacterium]
MAISRARKEALVAEYKQQLGNSSGIMIADYKGLSVSQMEDLRRRAREQDGQIFVVKNTLLKLILTEAGLIPPDDLFVNTTIVAFCHQEIAPLAKLFREFAREMEEGRFVVKGGLLEGKFLSAAEAIAVADMPSREVLMAQVLGTINAPATQLVSVVSSGIRQIVNVLQAYVDKLEEAGGNPAGAAA